MGQEPFLGCRSDAFPGALAKKGEGLFLPLSLPGLPAHSLFPVWSYIASEMFQRPLRISDSHVKKNSLHGPPAKSPLPESRSRSVPPAWSFFLVDSTRTQGGSAVALHILRPRGSALAPSLCARGPVCGKAVTHLFLARHAAGEEEGTQLSKGHLGTLNTPQGEANYHKLCTGGKYVFACDVGVWSPGRG